MPASRKEKDSTNHLEHRSINHPAGPKYLKDLALGYARTLNRGTRRSMDESAHPQSVRLPQAAPTELRLNASYWSRSRM